MRVLVAAVGRAAPGPERDLAARYIDRANRSGRAVGLAPVGIVELVEGRHADAVHRRREEAAALLRLVPAGAALVALDERGEDLSSQALADRVGRWRDAGRPALCFCLGGPDGHGEGLMNQADLRLAFGRATWPHLLVRAMLCEQIYRVVSILAGHPYHRA